jgi:hypothetical protein
MVVAKANSKGAALAKSKSVVNEPPATEKTQEAAMFGFER